MHDLTPVHDPTPDVTRVLVVDDDEDIRGFLQVVLTDEGCSTAVMPNGQLALEWLEASPHVPSLILLDLMMPQMDGWEFLARANQDPRLRGIPVAIMSAHRTVQDAFDGRASHFRSFFLLPKPIDFSRLIAIVAGVMPPDKALGE
ncbi:MAG TPA: response regulator [Polyangiaceae bacterium]|nr:response regulator [Polyangiaceae bacterium]